MGRNEQEEAALKNNKSKFTKQSELQFEMESENDNRVDEVRELLFGARLREQEKQFQALQNRIADELNGMQSAYNQKLSDLESYFKQEIKSMSERIRVERNGWEQAWEKTNLELSNLRELILERSKSLSDEVRSAQKRQSDDFARDIHLLSETKVARSQMVEFLNSWSMKFAYEMTEPKDAH